MFRNRFFSHARYVLSTLIVALLSAVVTAVEVSIPDPALESLLRAYTNIETGPLTDVSLSSLTLIRHLNKPESSSFVKIQNLEGLQYATSLRTLLLDGNDVRDLSPLNLLDSLERLDLNENPNLELSDLSELTQLKQLRLSNNGITQTSFLSTLKNLEYLSLSRNELTEIPFLSNHNELRNLYLSDNKISNVAPISGAAKLQLLVLSSNNISNLSGLTDLPWLNYLGLKSNPIQTGGATLALENVNIIDISECSLNSLSFLPATSAIERIYAENNKFHDLSEFSKYPNIREIRLNNNYISSLKDLSTFSNLEEIELDENYIDTTAEIGLINQYDSTLSKLSIANQKTAQFATSGEVTFTDHRSQTKRIAIIESNSYWHAESNADWITLLQESGYDGVELIANIQENTTDTRRSATININDTTFTLEQAPITIPDLDPILEAAIREKLVKPTGPINSVDLLSLTKLSSTVQNASESEQIKSLNGLEYAQNLTELTLMGHSFTEVNALSFLLNLRKLTILTNKPINPAPISKLINLTYLRLEDCGIQSIDFLSSLKKVQTLTLAVNQIEDLDGIQNLSELEFLVAGDNLISDIKELQGLSHIKTLDLRNCKIASITPIYELTALETLDLSNNPLSDIERIGELDQLTSLTINNTSGLSYTPISNLVSLNYLILRYDEIEDISFLSKLTNLKGLEIDNNRIRNVSPLAELSELNYLQIYSNYITDISSLAKLIPYNGVWLHRNLIDFTEGTPSVATITTWREVHSIPLNSLDQYTPWLNATATKELFQYESNSGSISVESNNYWSVSSDADWLKLDTSSGFLNGTIEFHLEENETNLDRIAVLTFGDQTATIVQRQNLNYFSYLADQGIDPSDTSYWPLSDKDGDGKTNTFEVQTGTDLEDPNSYFHYEIKKSASNEAVLTISKRSDGTDYQLQSSENLKDWLDYTPAEEEDRNSMRHVTLPVAPLSLLCIRARLDNSAQN